MTTVNARAILRDALVGFGLGLVVTASVGWWAAGWAGTPPPAAMLAPR